MPTKRKLSKTKAEPNGEFPDLQVAAICERVLREVDGSFSIIRLIDTIHLPEELLPPHGETLTLPLILLVGFKGGKAVGEGEIVLRETPPVGPSRVTRRAPIGFQGDEKGSVTQWTGIEMRYRGYGLYRYTVTLNRGGKVRLLTRVPLRLLPPK